MDYKDVRDTCACGDSGLFCPMCKLYLGDKERVYETAKDFAFHHGISPSHPIEISCMYCASKLHLEKEIKVVPVFNNTNYQG